MPNVAFEDTRFDPDLTPFHDLAKAMAQAFGYAADLALDRQLAQLVRLRVAQVNHCSSCLILHSRAARDAEIEQAKIDNLGSWWESRLYAEGEAAALADCDALTEGNRAGFDSVDRALAEHFRDVEIAELAAIVISMNPWSRLKLAQGATPVFERGHAERLS